MKDLERKVANLFMDNVALTTKLKASREVERQQQEEVTSLKERLVQALRAQVSIHYCYSLAQYIDYIQACPPVNTTGNCCSRAVTVKGQRIGM